MRFLIFNLVVFLSIGYLFTAAPGQSVGNWIDATIDKVSRTVALAPPTDAPKHVLAPANMLAQSATATSTPVAAENDDIKINDNKIQKIISDSINSYLKEIVAGSGGIQADNTASLPRVPVTNTVTADKTAPLPIDRASQTAAKAKTPGPVEQNTTLPTVIRASAEADELLASGFSELYPADQKVLVAARDELAPQNIIAAPVFMNSGDRQAALSELIQNLQLTYIKRAGQ
jgi:hypothetical protein